MNKVKILCHSCEGRGYILEQTYEEGMFIATDRITQGTLSYDIINSEGIKVQVPIVSVICPECQGRRFVEEEKDE